MSIYGTGALHSGWHGETLALTRPGTLLRRKRALAVRACLRCGTEFVIGGAGNPHKRRKYCSFPCSYPKRSRDGMKQCARCLVNKPATLEHYRKQHKAKDGLHCWCIACFESYRRAKASALRLETLTHYSSGIPRCACCDERLVSFLTIDHVRNDGNSHRQEIGTSGSAVYIWLKRNGFPEGFQVLCWNCNLGKALNAGVCPHRKA